MIDAHFSCPQGFVVILLHWRETNYPIPKYVIVEIRISQTDPIFIFFLQSLLASVSKPTKLALGRVGMFSVASLNAIVSSYYYTIEV